MLPGCAYKHACIELFLLLFVLLFIKGRDFCMCLFFLAKKKSAFGFISFGLKVALGYAGLFLCSAPELQAV